MSNASTNPNGTTLSPSNRIPKEAVDNVGSEKNGSEGMGSDGETVLEEESELYQMSSFYCACIMVALCVIGLAGNWLSVYVFSRRSMRCSSINVLLTGLSATDFFLLLIVVPIFALPPLASQTGSSRSLDDFTHYMIAYVYPLALILQTASVWIFMLITIERFLAVCVPLRVGQYCTVGRSRAALGLVYVTAFAYNLVRFWEYTTEECQDTYCGTVVTVPMLRSNPDYWLWYGTVLYLLTQFLVPFLLIAVLNGCVIYKMYQARRQRALLSSSEKSEHRTAMMMIIVVVVFAACYSLSFVLNIHEAIDPQIFYRPETSAMAYLLNDISNTLVVLNSACTFLVYLGFSRRYRFIARWTLLRCLPRPLLKRWLSEDALEAATRKTLFLHSVIPKDTSTVGRCRIPSSTVPMGRPLANGHPASAVPVRRNKGVPPGPLSTATDTPLLHPTENPVTLSPSPLKTTSQESLLSPGRRPSTRHRYLPLPSMPPKTKVRSALDLPTLSTGDLRTGPASMSSVGSVSSRSRSSSPPKASPEHSSLAFSTPSLREHFL